MPVSDASAPDVIAHFTASSLEHDTSVSSKDSVKVEKTASVYSACFEPTKGFAAQARLLAEMHVAIMDEAHVRLCSEGRRRLQAHAGPGAAACAGAVFGVDRTPLVDASDLVTATLLRRIAGRDGDARKGSIISELRRRDYPVTANSWLPLPLTVSC